MHKYLKNVLYSKISIETDLNETRIYAVVLRMELKEYIKFVI